MRVTSSRATDPADGPAGRYGASDLLRFSTAGSVDDGKSTLIGRLLFDAKQTFDDQLQAIERTSKARGDAYVDLALLTDGLRAEREQGITIDVAYRYFQTPRRKFILADTPGHVQYTRNMVTGASTADLALILVDARHGLLEQTRRHASLATLLGIPHLVLCVNKMDLAGYEQAVFDRIRADFDGVRRQAARDARARDRRGGDPDLGAARRQRGRSVRGDALVRRPRAARLPGVGGGGLGSQPRRRSPAGAVRHPSRGLGLPRLRGRRGRGHPAPRATR